MTVTVVTVTVVVTVIKGTVVVTIVLLPKLWHFPVDNEQGGKTVVRVTVVTVTVVMVTVMTVVVTVTKVTVVVTVTVVTLTVVTVTVVVTVTKGTVVVTVVLLSKLWHFPVDNEQVGQTLKSTMGWEHTACLIGPQKGLKTMATCRPLISICFT